MACGPWSSVQGLTTMSMTLDIVVTASNEFGNAWGYVLAITNPPPGVTAYRVLSSPGVGSGGEHYPGNPATWSFNPNGTGSVCCFYNIPPSTWTLTIQVTTPSGMNTYTATVTTP